MLLEEGIYYDKTVLLRKLLAFAYFILCSKVKLACYPKYPLTARFCIPTPYDEKDFFFL